MNNKKHLNIIVFIFILGSTLLLTACHPATYQGFTQDDLIYFMMTDRFYNGDTASDDYFDVDTSRDTTYHGGDLKGITQKLDYIESLGATAIWITPVVDNQNNGYHGYWAIDFYHVDEHLGTMDDFKELVDECHKRDIKVVMDYVVNHTGYNSDWYRKEPDWFNERADIIDWNNQEQVEKGWLADLPDFNFENKEVRQYFIDNALWWIKETNIDGIRLDTVKHVPIDYWQEFSSAIKQEYPNFYLMGEVWHNQSRYLANYQQAGLDGITNYSLYDGMRKAFSMNEVYSLCSALRNEDEFEHPELNTIFIDNHDNTRFATHATANSLLQTKQALTFIMSYPAIPVIYYGTELGMKGDNDPDNRQDMAWNTVENNEMLEYYNELVKIRHYLNDQRLNEFELVDYDRYFLAYKRKNSRINVLFVINTINNSKDVTIQASNSSCTYYDYFTHENYECDDNGILTITLDELETMILFQEEPS